jgi:hypothetical protein
VRRAGDPARAVTPRVDARDPARARRTKVLARAALLAALLATLAWTPARTAAPAGAVVAPRTPVLYLDIGASVSVGVQPTPRAPRGEPTNRGYANRLVRLMSARGVTMTLTQLGCPGESIATMLHGPDPCYVAPDTQLLDAVAFLKDHRGSRILVTVDLGFNTLNVCFHHLDIDLSCVRPHLATLRTQLTQVMRILTSAASSRVTFVGVGHYNPYLIKATREGAAETFALNSVTALRRLNTVLAQVYGSFGAKTADVAEAFHEEDVSVTRNARRETTTANVVYECRYTWMCAPKPFGPNIHPTDAGYQAIAGAILRVLPRHF